MKLRNKILVMGAPEFLRQAELAESSKYVGQSCREDASAGEGFSKDMAPSDIGLPTTEVGTSRVQPPEGEMPDVQLEEAEDMEEGDDDEYVDVESGT